MQERKANKLERKKQAKPNSSNGPANQGSAATSDAASSSSTSPPAAEAPKHEMDAAQPSQTDGSQDTAGQGAEDVASGSDARDDNPSSSPEDFDHTQEARTGQETHQDGQHRQLLVSTADSPTEPYDVLQEFESLSPVLPDMPKPDTHDDLAGLFQAAFATCHQEMSPHGRPPQSPFSSHGQDCEEEEDYSLYNDADEVMADDEAGGTPLDASDEEEREEVGEAAGALLESFMGDAEHAAQLQASYNAQAGPTYPGLCL